MKTSDRIRIVILYVVIAAVMSIVPGRYAFAQDVSYTGGVQYSTGTYFFTEHTNSIYISNGLSVTGEPFRAFFTVPFIIQSTPWISYSPGGGIPTGGMHQGQVGTSESPTGGSGQQDMFRRGQRHIVLQDTISYRQSSFSDPSLGGSWRLVRSSSGNTILNLNSTIKFPLTDPQTGFGTGSWDLGVGLSTFQRMGLFFLSGDLMYWRLGNMKELTLENPISISLGGGKAFFDGKVLTSAIYTASTEIVEGFDPPSSLIAGVGYMVSTGTSLNGNISFGLSESSSSFAVGLGWSVKL
ncbi:MAG: hypothetical protein ACQER4_03830 [Bacteroidota bacterium]